MLSSRRPECRCCPPMGKGISLRNAAQPSLGKLCKSMTIWTAPWAKVRRTDGLKPSGARHDKPASPAISAFVLLGGPVYPAPGVGADRVRTAVLAPGQAAGAQRGRRAGPGAGQNLGRRGLE